jgi:DNA polymerase-3 subunit alpha
MGPLTDVGMLKCDFLGLKTLTVIRDAVNLIHRHTPDFDIDTIPMSDQATFDVYNRGETTAVFQVESGGMVNVCRQFDVRDIEDINAILALYRPGPMELIPDYIKRKKGLQKIKAPHPLLLPITTETFGVLVYQEQVMQAAQIMAGYTLGGADLLRRAMGKKDKEKMAKEREKFIEGAGRLHGVKPDTANEVFDTLEKFAGYGFNRSHSAAYAWVSYQTGYLKGNYPVEFMAGVMSNEVSNTDKISVFVAECERMGIDILPPDINLAGLKFEPAGVSIEGVEALKAMRRRLVSGGVEEKGDGAPDDGEGVPFEELPEEKPAKKGGKNTRAAKKEPAAPVIVEKPQLGAIRFGLAAIKNVGEAAMEAAIAEREKNGPFKSLEDFCSRVDSRKINKKAIECLVKCGAFDFTNVERAQLFSEIDGAMAAAASTHKDRAVGQSSLFDTFEAAPKPVKKTTHRVPPWSLTEKLAYEKELLGFYVTGHPLDEYRSLLEGGKYVPIAALPNEEDKSTVSIAGALVSVEKKFTKKDSKPFAIVVLEDLTGSLEVMIWSEAYTKSQALLLQGSVVSITGKLNVRDEGVRLAADEVKALKKPAPSEKPLVLKFNATTTSEADLLTVRQALESSPGTRRVELVFTSAAGRTVRLVPGDEFRVNWNDEVRERLQPWLNV